jgi:formate dehydrogenase gamma subunit
MRIGLLGLLAVLCSAALAGEPVQDRVCFKCHADQAQQAKFKDGTTLSVFIDKARFSQSVHGRKGQRCVECHADIEIDSHPERELTSHRSYRVEISATCNRCHDKSAARMAKNAHAKGGKDDPVCADCHNPHYDVTKPNGASTSLVQACAKCHAEISKMYSKSAHGAGHDGVPVCTNCHRLHEPTSADTTASRLHTVSLCETCHGDPKKMASYGLSTDVMQTYLQDFHGLAVRYSKTGNSSETAIKATCVDCHGFHNTPGKSGPGSLTMKSNLATVCRKCHPGATEQFSAAWLSHYIPSPDRAPMVYFAQLFYRVFIPFMVVGLLTLIAMDFVHLMRNKPASHKAAPGEAMYTRFSLFRRVEHISVMASFILLVVTGLPQKFHDQQWAEWIIGSLGGLDNVRLFHRIVGLIFAVQASCHVALNLIWLFRRRIHADMMVDRKDFTDTLASIKIALGLKAEAPKFGRYEFRQKFEYWGMLMGGAVMIGTGFVLLFPVLFAQILPGQLIAVAKVAHSFEALMALLVIVIWHLYCGLLRPGLFPLDTSIFTGKIPMKRLMEDHPLEYARVQKEHPAP